MVLLKLYSAASVTGGCGEATDTLYVDRVSQEFLQHQMPHTDPNHPITPHTLRDQAFGLISIGHRSIHRGGQLRR